MKNLLVMKNLFKCSLLLCCVSTMIFPFPKVVMIIRHAEKTANEQALVWTDSGHEFSSGITYSLHNTQPLSPKGWERAFSLAPFFTMNPDIKAFGEIVALFAPKPDEAYNSVRPIQTLTPLSHEIRLPIQVMYGLDQATELINDIMTNPVYHNKTILIAYEHKHIPGLAQSFESYASGKKAKKGKKDKFGIPSSWKESAFDRVFVLEFNGQGNLTKFTNMPQTLMFGDSKEASKSKPSASAIKTKLAKSSSKTSSAKKIKKNNK